MHSEINTAHIREVNSLIQTLAIGRIGGNQDVDDQIWPVFSIYKDELQQRQNGEVVSHERFKELDLAGLFGLVLTRKVLDNLKTKGRRTCLDRRIIKHLFLAIRDFLATCEEFCAEEDCQPVRTNLKPRLQKLFPTFTRKQISEGVAGIELILSQDEKAGS